MKKLYVCQVIDSISETVVSTFTAPTPAYFARQMESFMKDCEKKSIPVADFEGFIVASVDICETFNEAIDFLKDEEVASFTGLNYLNLKDVANEVPSDV